MSELAVVSKAYKNKKISDIIYDISKNYLNIEPSRFHVIEPTSGLYDIIIPTYKPFEAIEMVTARSFDESGKYAYRFFESTNGFNFVSLQTLYKKAKNRTLKLDIKSVNDEPNSSSDVSRNRDSLQGMTIKNDFDTTKMAAKGAYSSTLLLIDLLNQEFKSYKYSIDNAKPNLLNKNPQINNPTFSKSNLAHYKTYIQANNNDVHKWMMNGQMHRALIENFIIEAGLGGDTTLNAGDVVSIEFPKFAPADESGKELDPFRSCKYLITGLVHVFKLVNNKGIFETNLEMCADSWADSLPTAKSKVDKAIK